GSGTASTASAPSSRTTWASSASPCGPPGQARGAGGAVRRDATAAGNADGRRALGMKLTWRWITEFLRTDLTPQAAADRLTNGGVEVGGAEAHAPYPPPHHPLRSEAIVQRLLDPGGRGVEAAYALHKP